MYTTECYEEIFCADLGETPEERIELLRDKSISKMRVKTIRAGNMLDCEIYPVWDVKPSVLNEKTYQPQRRVQKDLNDRNTKKKITRLLNENFTERDIWATFTYTAKNLPTSMDSACRDIINYIRRLKRHIEKIKGEPLKYIYVTEYSESEYGVKHVHHHIVMNFPDRDKAESLWKGGRTHSRILQPDDFSLTGLACYLGKCSQNRRRWCASKNLKKPKVTTADNKLSRRAAERLVKNENEIKDKFEKLYKGYQFLDAQVTRSDFVGGVYIYVRMRKRR